jgi:hypothetical protein
MSVSVLKFDHDIALAAETLGVIAAGLASSVTGEELAPAAGEPRRFVRLLDGGSYEAWLIAWGPDGGLDLHDHGGSRGAVHVVRGRLTETYADGDRSGRLRTRSLPVGSSLDVPADRVHEVWNPGPGDALSVHVYSPPLTSMTFYERDGDGGRLVPARRRRGDAPELER